MGRLKPYINAKSDIVIAAAAQIKEAESVRLRCVASKFEVKFIAAYRSTLGAKAAQQRYSRLNGLNTTWTNEGGSVDMVHPSIWAEHEKVIKEARRLWHVLRSGHTL
jgi:hypothetical protein